METQSKSEILQGFAAIINEGIAKPQDVAEVGEATEKKSGKVIKWTIQVCHPETMVDANGCKWIRAPGE